jgi:hypothetical protein
MTIDKTEDKRRFQRIFYNAEAVLAGDSVAQDCMIVDLSLKGCLLEFDQPWSGAMDTLYALTIHLTDQIRIVMQLTVVHVVGNHCGFKCQHIDIDSITALRRLVELNLGDSELLERELAALSDPGGSAS